jgi:hypothetical protein
MDVAFGESIIPDIHLKKTLPQTLENRWKSIIKAGK